MNSQIALCVANAKHSHRLLTCSTLTLKDETRQHLRERRDYWMNEARKAKQAEEERKKAPVFDIFESTGKSHRTELSVNFDKDIDLAVSVDDGSELLTVWISYDEAVRLRDWLTEQFDKVKK